MTLPAPPRDLPGMAAPNILFTAQLVYLPTKVLYT